MANDVSFADSKCQGRGQFTEAPPPSTHFQCHSLWMMSDDPYLNQYITNVVWDYSPATRNRSHGSMGP